MTEALSSLTMASPSQLSVLGASRAGSEFGVCVFGRKGLCPDAEWFVPPSSPILVVHFSRLDDGTWASQVFHAHQVGCNSVSWAPATAPGSLISGNTTVNASKKLVTAGCDNLVRIWK